jgi:RNA polymerase sigma-70 factor (ECF subfamily)
MEGYLETPMGETAIMEHPSHAMDRIWAPQRGVTVPELATELARLHDANFAWALHCCRHRGDDAEDLLQEVYMKVLDGRARFEGRSTFKTWLFGVIRRTARERRRTRWLHDGLLGHWHRREPDAAPPGEPENALLLSERNTTLRRALARLPHRQQEVLHLVFYQDLTIEEAARTLKISLGSARTHFARGKQRLRGDLEEDFARDAVEVRNDD